MHLFPEQLIHRNCSEHTTQFKPKNKPVLKTLSPRKKKCKYEDILWKESPGVRVSVCKGQ